MKEILVIIILFIIVIYSVRLGLYMLYAIIERKKAVKDFKKRNRPDLLHEDLKKIRMKYQKGDLSKDHSFFVTRKAVWIYGYCI